MLCASDPPLSLGQCATLACLLEASAPKPGNVHRGADFEDLVFDDFLAAAVAIGPEIELAPSRRVGETVLAAIRATRRLVATNANLGAVLLLAPLAKVPRDVPLFAGIGEVLAAIGPADARDVYTAIRLAAPGGLGRSDEHDLAGEPPGDLLAAMRHAAGRDLVARQYAEGFEQVLKIAVPWLEEGLARGWPSSDAIVHAQIRLMAEFPDSLIARKCGVEVARQSAAMAGRAVRAGGPGDEDYQRALADLDFWLRADGHRRNPGTTADVIAAALFAIVRDGVTIAA